MSGRVLVTGGAGYLGTHAICELLQAGFEVCAVDNFSTAGPEGLARVEQIAGRAPSVHAVDIRDADALARVFDVETPDAVVHFAAFKAVRESQHEPLRYYDNNVVGTIRLLEAMERAGCRRIVFSSTAGVYGEDAPMPVSEDSLLGEPTNVYARTKVQCEHILRDLSRSNDAWTVLLLRYFNPVGAHPSALIGEDPLGVPRNVMPILLQVAAGTRECLEVFGTDFPTPDGTALRDYIHVMDIGRGHVAAVQRSLTRRGLEVFNLGTGRPVSVLELRAAVEAASGKSIPVTLGERRAGDVPVSYADASRARELLGWHPRFDLADMARDAWRWQQQSRV